MGQADANLVFSAAAFRTYVLGHDEREHMTQTLNYWKMQRSLQDTLTRVIDTVANDTVKTPEPVAEPIIVPPRRRSWFSKFILPKPRSLVALVGT